MKIVEEGPDTSRNEQKKNQLYSAGNIYLGAVLIIIGCVWLFKNIGVIGYRVFDVLFSWPMLIIVASGYLFIIRKWAAGAITGMLGLIFLFSQVFGFYIPVGRIVMPLAVLAIGVAIVFSQNKKK